MIICNFPIFNNRSEILVVFSTKRFLFNFNYTRNIAKVAGFDMAKDIYPVDFPDSTVGEGSAAWIKAMSDNMHSIVYYKTAFILTNITPQTFDRMRKTGKKKVFYLSHYKTFYNRGDTPYTVHFMWPMWVGKPPKGILTQNFTEWHNPWHNNRLEKIYVGEFAFINMLHIPFYANQWELLDFTKSPWDSLVGEKWWKDHFIKGEGWDYTTCFGYAVYCFTPGHQESLPSYVPLLGCDIDQVWKTESDQYKRTMVEVNRRMGEIPEHWFWEREASLREDELIAKIRKRERFVKKWTYLGFHPDKPMKGLEIQDPLNAYLPDGKKKDPEGENIGEYFNKAIDPATYFLRKNCPPENFDPIAILKKGKDSLMEDYIVPNPYLRTRIRDENDSYSGSDSDDEAALAFLREIGEIRYTYDPVYGWSEVLYPEDLQWGPPSRYKYDSDEEFDLTNFRDLRKIDKLIREKAECFVQFNEALGIPYEDYDARQAHIRTLERYLRVNMGLPPTPVHTPPLTDEELSSDEEGYYSASWVRYGDISSYKHFWDDADGYDNEIANDLMEDWAQELRDERGDRNDNLDWKTVAESSFEGIWPARPQSWPFQDFFRDKYRFWDDPRHEE
jgi:hypothetical protein